MSTHLNQSTSQPIFRGSNTWIEFTHAAGSDVTGWTMQLVLSQNFNNANTTRYTILSTDAGAFTLTAPTEGKFLVLIPRTVSASLPRGTIDFILSRIDADPNTYVIATGQIPVANM